MFVSMISDKLVCVYTGSFEVVVDWNNGLILVEDMSISSSGRACTTAVTAPCQNEIDCIKWVKYLTFMYKVVMMNLSKMYLNTFATISSTSSTTAAPKRRPKYLPKQFDSLYALFTTKKFPNFSVFISLQTDN